MGLEMFLVWLLVGLVAGWLASAVVGGGFGVIGDLVVGIVGSLIGGFIFRATGLDSPVGGIAGSIFVAFVGAVLLLLLLRGIRRLSAKTT